MVGGEGGVVPSNANEGEKWAVFGFLMCADRMQLVQVLRHSGSINIKKKMFFDLIRRTPRSINLLSSWDEDQSDVAAHVNYKIGNFSATGTRNVAGRQLEIDKRAARIGGSKRILNMCDYG